MYSGEPILIYNLYGQFEEIATLLADTLTRRGYQVTRTREVTYGIDRLYILFGANVWEDMMLLPQRFIIYQLEQSPIKKWFVPAYFARLALAEQVWDYNLQNVEYLRERGIDAIHVPIGYAPIFDPIAPHLPDSVDILFLGQLRNAHRSQVIKTMRANGLQVVARNDVFGLEKKQLVAQAKIVLNIHYGNIALFEEARIIPLLAAGKVVISEVVNDPRYTELYKPYVIFANDTAHLITLCREWLQRSADERQQWGQRARQWITTQRTAYNLFPWEQVERVLPTAPYYASPLSVPDNIAAILTDRFNHLIYPGWQAVRHYGRKTLLRRIQI